MNLNNITNIAKKILSDIGSQTSAQELFEKGFQEDEFMAVTLEDEIAERLATSGLDGNLDPIEPPYTLFTVQKKRMNGQEADFVTLRDTGKFHKSITAKLTNGIIETFTTDSKTPKLRAKYGDDITDPSEREVEILRDRFLVLILGNKKAFLI